MKHVLITAAFCLLATACFSQFQPQQNLPSPEHELALQKMELRNAKLFWIGTGLSFVSGFSYGAREVVQHKPWRIPSDWNTEWWDTRESWKNKYFQRDPEQGRNRMPVMFTDAYHLSGTIHRWTTTGAGICVGLNTRNQDWKRMGLNLLWNFLAFQAGFTLTYRSGAIFPR